MTEAHAEEILNLPKGGTYSEEEVQKVLYFPLLVCFVPLLVCFNLSLMEDIPIHYYFFITSEF